MNAKNILLYFAMTKFGFIFGFFWFYFGKTAEGGTMT